GRVGEVEVAHIEDHVAVVGDEALAQCGLAAQGNELPCHQAARHGNDFDRQWKCAEQPHQLAVIRDADETPARFRHDLFPRQRPAATLDELELPVRLVGTVDVDVQGAGLVEIKYGYSRRAQASGGRLGAGHRAFNAVADAAKCIDEVVYGRAGADADDSCVVEMIQRGTGGRALLVVSGHDRFPVEIRHCLRRSGKRKGLREPVWEGRLRKRKGPGFTRAFMKLPEAGITSKPWRPSSCEPSSCARWSSCAWRRSSSQSSWPEPSSWRRPSSWQLPSSLRRPSSWHRLSSSSLRRSSSWLPPSWR